MSPVDNVVLSGGGDRQHARRWWILALVAFAQLMVVLDATIVSIALPSAQKALHFSNGDRPWIITAYTLAFGGLLLVGGRIGDLFGRKPTLIAGLIGFGAASAAGGMAQSFAVLAGARALQGAFGALLAPTALSVSCAPDGERAEVALRTRAWWPAPASLGVIRLATAGTRRKRKPQHDEGAAGAFAEVPSSPRSHMSRRGGAPGDSHARARGFRGIASARQCGRSPPGSQPKRASGEVPSSTPTRPPPSGRRGWFRRAVPGTRTWKAFGAL